MILVNASWWIMAVLLDFSTVMTVNFGALPLIVVGQEKDEEKNPLW
ncbi:MAG: hypothetical protein H6765_03960 [Candidatus Peribacteria bacterium]|nr:MAG: hypothetical protein H6765_03960 [Candidatus Peribacteria bacterium]